MFSASSTSCSRQKRRGSSKKEKLIKRKTDKKKMEKNGKRNKGKIGNAGISASAYPASAEASTVNRRNQIAAQAINPASMQPSFGSRQQTIWAIDGLEMDAMHVLCTTRTSSESPGFSTHGSLSHKRRIPRCQPAEHDSQPANTVLQARV